MRADQETLPTPYVRPHDDEPAHEHVVSPDVWGEGGGLGATLSKVDAARQGVVEKKTARSWLGTEGLGPGGLRRAVVLHEIFGPPISLRDTQNSE